MWELLGLGLGLGLGISRHYVGMYTARSQAKIVLLILVFNYY